MNSFDKVEEVMSQQGVRSDYKLSKDHREIVFSYLNADDIKTILSEGCENLKTLVPSSSRILKELDPTKPLIRLKFSEEGFGEFIKNYDKKIANAGYSVDQVIEAFARAATMTDLPDTDWCLDVVNNCYSIILREEFTAAVTSKLFNTGYDRYLETLSEEERANAPKAILSSVFAISCQRDGRIVQVRMVV